ncbi:MAG: hypothetical protein GW823_00790 [Bacteroidetes bacterium]|nr:hypothetical protein [Bacteroidota bacterium]
MKAFFTRIFTYLIVGSFFFSCSRLPKQAWYESLPNSILAVYIPENGSTVNSIIDSKAGSFFDDITTSALPITKKLELAASQSISTKAIAFYPNESDQVKTVWIAENISGITDKLRMFFSRPLFKDHYTYNGISIYKLFIDSMPLFVLEHGDILYISESSMAIEDIIACLNLGKPKLKIQNNMLKNENVLVVNAAKMDQFISHYTAVKYKPNSLGAFDGLETASFSFAFNESETIEFTMNGLIPLSEVKTNFTSSISFTNSEITLDQYVPIDVAYFSIHFSKPKPIKTHNPISKLDSTLQNSSSLLQELSDALDDEIALAGFAPSGLAGVGENLVIRKIKDTRAIYDWLKKLEGMGLVYQTDRTFYFRSESISKTISSGLSTYDTFYISITSESLVMSPRLGLTKRVRSDRSRRRVISYNKTYIESKNTLSEPISSFFYLESQPFEDFVNHYLANGVDLKAFTSKFEILAGKSVLDVSSNSLAITINGFTKNRSTQPFEEKWIAPLDGADITGTPIIADIGGNKRPEIVIATENGNVLGIASDGTSYFNASTSDDTPIGSPIVFDWYGNGQLAIFVAAENKIYGWNSSGSLLPKFPIALSEKISSPLLIADINRDGNSEMIVTSADRQIHALDGRGVALKGWPVTVTSEITLQPVFERQNGKWLLFAQADNGLFAFDALGKLQTGFPIFISATFTSKPALVNNDLLMGGADGFLYQLGSERMFIDSLNVFRNTPYDSISSNLRLSARYLSNSSINASPIFVENLTIKTDSLNKYSENMILTQSSDGGIYVLNTKGELRFTISMGQPSSNNAGILLADIQKDKKPEVLATAGFGRLYAWQLYNGNRYFDLPTYAIDFPILADIDFDGFPELIAQTRGGLRCWTIYGNRSE